MRLLPIFLFILFLPVVSAANLLHSGDLIDNEETTMLGKTFLGKYYASAGKGSIAIDTTRLLIPVGSCVDNAELVWRICLNSAEEKFVVVDDVGKYSNTMLLSIYEYGPSITITRTISDTEPDLNEEVELTTTILNEGNERATDLVVIDDFPSSVYISGSKTDRIFNRLYWTGSLMPDKEEKFTYRVTFKDFIKFNSTAEVSYIYKGQTRKDATSTELFEISKPYEISNNVSSQSPALNEIITYTFLLKNTDQTNDMDILDMDIVIPKNVNIFKRPNDVESNGNTMSYTGRLNKDSEKLFEVKVQSSYKGEYEIKTTAKLRMSGIEFDEKLTEEFGVGVSNIAPTITLSKEVTGGTDLSINATVKNRGKEAINISSLEFTSDLFTIRAWKKKVLEPGEVFEIERKTIQAPMVDEKSTYFAEISGYYFNDMGNTLDFKERQTVTVNPPEKFVEITPEIQISGREAFVKLKIKNTKSYDLTGLDIIDTLPKGFDHKGTRNREIEKIGPMEEIEAYSYTVIPPSSFTKSTFTINHVFNAKGKDDNAIMREKSTTIDLADAIKPKNDTVKKEEKKEETKTEKNETDDDKSDETEDKGPGFFGKVWKSIKGMFSWMFGGDDKEDVME